MNRWITLYNKHGSYVKCENGEVIAQMVGDFSRGEKENHAKLIAAAPELLSCLMWYVENDDTNEILQQIIADDTETNAYYLEWLEKARAAIKKATK